MNRLIGWGQPHSCKLKLEEVYAAPHSRKPGPLGHFVGAGGHVPFSSQNSSLLLVFWCLHLILSTFMSSFLFILFFFCYHFHGFSGTNEGKYLRNEESGSFFCTKQTFRRHSKIQGLVLTAVLLINTWPHLGQELCQCQEGAGNLSHLVTLTIVSS